MAAKNTQADNTPLVDISNNTASILTTKNINSQEDSKDL